MNECLRTLTRCARQGCGTAFSLALPADAAPAPSHGAAAAAPATALARVAAAAASLRAELRACYATRPLRLLAFWWVAGSVAGSFTENYGTNLFFDIDPSDDANGHVTFVTRSLCCIAALAAVKLERGASEGGALTLAGGVAVAGVAIGALASATSLLPAYCAYAAALTALQFCTCVLYAQSAHALDDACANEDANEDSAREEPAGEDAAAAPVRAPRGRTAVLFGANATVSLAVQSCVQAVAAAARAPPRAQFAVLSACVRIAWLRARSCERTRVCADARGCAAGIASRSLRSPPRPPPPCVHAPAPGASSRRAPPPLSRHTRRTAMPAATATTKRAASSRRCWPAKTID
jgi:hypothetical protein